MALIVLPLIPEFIILGASAIASSNGCRVDAAPPDAGGSRIGSEIPPDSRMVAEGFASAPGSLPGSPGEVCAKWPFPPFSSIIRLALKAGFVIGVSFSSGLAALWLLLCYVAITGGWGGVSRRLALAFFVSLLFAFVPYFGPMLSIGYLVNPHCLPNEGGTGPCVIYGGDIGGIAHDSVALGYDILEGAPIAFGALGLYALFLLGALLAAWRRTRGSPSA